MPLSESLEFLLTADPTKVVGAFAQVTQASEKSLQGTESNVAKIGSAMTKIGAGGLGVGGVLTQLGSKEEAAAGQLQAAIGQVGQAYSDYSARIDDAIQTQVHFGNTESEAKNAITTLTVAYGDTGKALDEMQLVTDLAARKHISLAEAATMVAKAHGGAARLFKEFGVEVQANADGTKNYDGALSQLAQKLQGQAAAGADTAMGKFRALRAEVENVVSSFGAKFGPAILGLSTVLTGVGAGITVVSGVLDKLRASHAASTLAAEQQAASDQAAAAALAEEAAVASASAEAELNANVKRVASNQALSFSDGEVATAMQAREAAEAQALIGNGALIAADEALTAADEELAAAAAAAAAANEAEGASLLAAAGPVGIVVGAVVALGAATGQFSDTLKVVSSDSLKQFGDSLQSAFSNLNGASNALDAVRKSLNDSLGKDPEIAKAFNEAGLTTDKFVDALKRGDTAFLSNVHASKEAKLAISELAGSTEDAARTQIEAAVASGQLDRAQADGAESADKLANGQTNYLGALQQLVSEGKLAPAVIDAVTNSMDAGASSTSPYIAGLKAVADEASKMQDSINQAADAAHQLLDANQQAQYAPLDIADARARAADAKAKLGTGKDATENAQLQRDYERATLDVTRAVDNAATAQQNLAVQQDAANGHTSTAVEKNGYLLQALKDMEQYVSGPYKDAIDVQIAQLQAVNDQLTAQQTLQEQIIHDSRVGNSNPDFEQNYHTGSGPANRAVGGSIGPDYTGWVGEQGPEYLTLSGGRGYVWTAGQASALSPSSGGGSSAPLIGEYHQTVVGANDEAVASATVRGLRRYAMTNRPR